MTSLISITPAYAALLALIFFGLSVRTLRLRRALQIPIGDADDQSMLRAMRVHANFAEYTPFALLLIFMLELSGVNSWLVHGLCICLTLGRLSHAFGVSKISENYRYRVFGMAMTFTALLGAAVSLLTTYALSILF
ncbi:MAG: MAPEG family protein [Arenicellales bacterium]|nr:MAPEG family protein [Arenicellales bacterium]